MITTIFAMLIAVVGIVLTIVYLINFLITKRKIKLRNAAIAFITTLTVTFTLLYIVDNQYPYAKPTKEVVLVARREAALGGILLRLYIDKTFELGNLREITSSGIYEINADTLTLFITKNSKGSKRDTNTSFVFDEEQLLEVKNTGIGFLEIHENRLR